LDAMARPRNTESAVLLPVCTSLIPLTEIARSPLVVCSVALVSAHAVAVPTPSDSSGAPAHTVANLIDVLIVIPLSREGGTEHIGPAP
jgi:hypothetical protein